MTNVFTEARLNEEKLQEEVSKTFKLMVSLLQSNGNPTETALTAAQEAMVKLCEAHREAGWESAMNSASLCF